MNEATHLSLPDQAEILQNCEDYIQHKVMGDQPALFHLQSGGSRLRARICIDAGLKLNLHSHDVLCLAAAVELLHNASLVHDDVQDEDSQRRGRPSVWKKFGQSKAICSGDMMLSAAYCALAELRSQMHVGAVMTESHRAVSQTIRGQNNDLSASDASTVAQYESIAAMKSGPLFRLSLSLPIIMAEKTDALNTVDQLASQFAIAYQINDDLLDWQKDMRSGQLNLVNILAAQSSREDALLVAKERACYLLRKCQKNLLKLPNNCATTLTQHASHLLKTFE